MQSELCTSLCAWRCTRKNKKTQSRIPSRITFSSSAHQKGCIPDASRTNFRTGKTKNPYKKCPYRRAPCTERCAELSLHISLCIPCSPIHHPPRGTNPRSPFRVPKRCLGRPPPHPGRDRAPLKEVAFQDRAAYDPVLSRPGCAAVALLPREPKRSG